MSILYKQSTYEDRIVSQSLNLADMFLTSSNAQYWAGKNNHHGVLTSFDWIPSSGSLTLLEANMTIEVASQHANNNWNSQFSQSIGLSPTSKKFDMDAMATYISESGHTSIIHVTRNVPGWQQQPHPNVLTKFNTILNNYGITSSSKYEVNYGQMIPDFDVPDTTFVLRYSYEIGSEIDETICTRDKFNSLVRSSGYSSYIQQLSGSWTTDFVKNEDGVPDVVVKKDYTFGGEGIQMFDVDSFTSNFLSSSYNYVEKYNKPDVNHLGDSVEVRGVVMMTPTKNIMVSQVPEYTGGDAWLNHNHLTSFTNEDGLTEYTYGNRKEYNNKFVTLVGEKVLSSSNEWIDIEDLTIGDVLVSYDTGSSEKGTTTISDIDLVQWGSDYLINNTLKFMSGSYVYNSSNGSSGWSFAQIQDVAVGSYILSSSLQSVQVSSSLARSTATANALGDRLGWVIDAEPSDHIFVEGTLVHDDK
tara:strand:+ start:318 stop:1730 length:1413 start_codon:yes stop_codon:yes gene_type:complete